MNIELQKMLLQFAINEVINNNKEDDYDYNHLTFDEANRVGNAMDSLIDYFKASKVYHLKQNEIYGHDLPFFFVFDVTISFDIADEVYSVLRRINWASANRIQQINNLLMICHGWV